jgi:hypothetical protein
MTKKEALPIITKNNEELTGTEHKGRKILGFIIAAIDANMATINIIAKRYLKKHDHKSYHGFVNHPHLYVKIHVILESEGNPQSEDGEFITEEWLD